MNPEEEIKQIADAIHKAGTDWLNKAKGVADAMPFVYQAIQTSQQFSSSFNGAPCISGLADVQDVRTALQQTQSLFASDPLTLREGTLAAAISGAAILSAATTHASSALAVGLKSVDLNIQTWAATNLAAFERIQMSEEKAAFIKRKLATLRAGSEPEFQNALDEYAKMITEATAPASAAIAMRNVLESLNGHLLEFARSQTKAEIKRWADAAAVIARGAPGSVQTAQLVLQKAVYDDLHAKKLTPAAKNDWVPSKAEWEGVYAQFIGFLFTVLGLIDFRDGS
jgi:hypothetical protein